MSSSQNLSQGRSPGAVPGRTQHLFVVRVWHEKSSVVPIAQWRGSVEHVTTGQRQYFADLQEIDRFIRHELDEEGALEEEGRPGANGAGGLSPGQAALVQQSFRALRPRLDEVVETFFARLFTQHPELRPLFAQDLTGMRAKFATMLTVIMEGLDDYARVEHIVRNLGRRHVEYGAQVRHFAPLGDALIGALVQADAAMMTPETQAAWRAAYARLAGTMLSSSPEGRSAP